MLRHPALTLGVLIPLFFLVGLILSLVPVADRAARFLPDQAGLQIMTVRPPAAGAGYIQVRRRDA